MESIGAYVSICAACDLAARLRTDLVTARNELRATETMFTTAMRWHDEELVPSPSELRLALGEHRCRVAALEQVLADLHCDHDEERDDAAA
jgi:hypothetical protein